MTRAEEKALEKYPVDICGYTVECRIGAKPQPQDWNEIRRTHFQEGYEQAEKNIISLIESRISEIIGDAQPKPALREELRELIKQIKEEK